MGRILDAIFGPTHRWVFVLIISKEPQAGEIFRVFHASRRQDRSHSASTTAANASARSSVAQACPSSNAENRSMHPDA